ncbi:synaptotagmin-1 [Eurytemora carolleeae]|uniref:synaptotagmin-1 n=1 Tax=Eurytemora carolleeae TaxID=1294199 RepID=UPI000C76ABAE|nr:synaptotagmin-1 [Eurytemora carolleeae]|eukprot:XP_023322614.1 synaptotagmin-1-like [Eurytemora affinis]
MSSSSRSLSSRDSIDSRDVGTVGFHSQDSSRNSIASTASTQSSAPHNLIHPRGRSKLGLGWIHFKIWKEDQHFFVCVKGCEELPSKDFIRGSCDPYVTVKVEEESCKPLRTKAKTKKLNPDFNETFQFDIGEKDRITLALQVMDKDLFFDDFIGEIRVIIETNQLFHKIPRDSNQQIAELPRGSNKLFVDDIWTELNPKDAQPVYLNDIKQYSRK